MSAYTYSVASSTHLALVAKDRLSAEIMAATIGAKFVGMSVDKDVLEITFDQDLTQEEQTTLTEIVTGHAGVPQAGIRQVVCSEVESDVKIDKDVYEDLISTVIATDKGKLVIQASIATSIDTIDSAVSFKLEVDKVDVQGARITPSKTAEGGYGQAHIQRQVPVEAGVHTVKVKWKVSAGVAYMHPIADGLEHASLLIMEVA
jgi:hypothetical protein